MMLALTAGLLMAGVGVTAQSTQVSTIPVKSGMPTLYYKPYFPPQVAPTSTVYGRFVTETFFAVDCKYASVQSIDDNKPQTGHFDAITTVAALTLTRIECIPETEMNTRRDLGHAQETDRPSPAVVISEDTHQKRATNQASVLALANGMADNLPPDVQGISLQAYEYLIQVNTALFAINLYNTGFDMAGTCAVLRDPVTAARLYVASIDPVQAANIICYAAQNGLYFDRSNSQLLSDLLGVIYSIEVKSGFTTNMTEICNSVNLSSLGYLGIDENGIESYLCGTNSTTTIPTATVANATSTAYGTGLSGTGGIVGTAGTGSPAPYANSTSPGYIPTGMSITATGPSAAASDTFSIIFPNVTGSANSSVYGGGHFPPSPSSSQYYPVWTTSTTPAPHMPRY